MGAAQYELTFPLVPRRRLEGLTFGAMLSIRRHTGSDVAGSRPYLPGDDMDTIDWNASARLSSVRDSDEFIVREHYAEEAPRVVLVCDRRPGMRLFPPGLPWLSKPEALVETARLIADSALKARSLLGYLDFAAFAHPDPELRSDGPFWRPPSSQTEHWRIREDHVAFPAFHAPEDNLSQAFEHLVQARRSLPAGSFVFVLSDFLASPSEASWAEVQAHPWDLIPVVIQDPVWEQSFPPVSSVVVPLADPTTGALRPVRLTAREAETRRRENEERMERILDELVRRGLEPIVVSTSDREQIFEAFLAWAEQRLQGVRERW